MLDLRIFRSFRARYYDDDILHGPAAYPPEYFDELRANGFNAVWLRGILRDLAPSTVFPELAADTARHQDALGTVIERARRCGVKVVLYLNEPLGVPGDHPFWKAHPEVRGVMERPQPDAWCMDPWPEMFALCSSAPEVRAWLREATARLFHDLPELGGWFAITASEHLTNCVSHGTGRPAMEAPWGCPRCRGRDPLDIVAEILTALRDGTRASSPGAACIAWNWSWDMYAPDPQAALLARLPRDMTLLLDWERGGQRAMPSGKRNFVDEYSLAYVGPSERFQAAHAVARQHGLAVMAKLQVGTTHELATVPNLALVDHLYEKLCRCEDKGLAGILGTWNFGNAFSLNTAAVARFVGVPARPAPAEFVRRLAADLFPGADAAGVARAVTRFSGAMAYFPFDMPFLYFGVANYALAYPLTLAPLTGQTPGASWMMQPRGDDLTRTLGQFTLDEIVDLLGQLVAEWSQGAAELAAALGGCAAPQARLEVGTAWTVAHCYRSTRNAYLTYRLRRDRPADAEPRFREIVQDEIANLEAALPWLEADPRLGFHAECQGQMFSAADVRSKLADLGAALGN